MLQDTVQVEQELNTSALAFGGRPSPFVRSNRRMEFFRWNINNRYGLIMTTYKEIRGTNIEAVASDPSNPVEGQVWYNTTTNAVKGFGRMQYQRGNGQ